MSVEIIKNEVLCNLLKINLFSFGFQMEAPRGACFTFGVLPMVSECCSCVSSAGSGSVG